MVQYSEACLHFTPKHVDRITSVLPSVAGKLKWTKQEYTIRLGSSHNTLPPFSKLMYMWSAPSAVAMGS